MKIKTILTIILTFILTVNIGDVFAVCTYPGSGDWTIEASEVCTVSSQTTVLNGNLNVYGDLSLSDVILKPNQNYDGQYGIYTYNGSKLSIKNSNVTSYNGYKYIFLVREGTQFELSDSYLSMIGWENVDYHRGLRVEADNCIVKNNHIVAPGLNYVEGIRFVYADNCIIENNTIETSGWVDAKGLELYYSDNNIVRNNNVTTTGDNHCYGIWLSHSSNNNVTDNTVSVVGTDASFGIMMEHSQGNLLKNNNVTCVGSTCYNIRGTSGSGNNDIDTTNLANGNIFYFYNAFDSNTIVDGLTDIGQISGTDTDNITIKNIELTNLRSPLVFQYVTNSRIENVISINNGIFLGSGGTSNITINNVSIDGGGIGWKGNGVITITNSDISSEGGYGIRCSNSNAVIIENITINTSGPGSFGFDLPNCDANITNTSIYNSGGYSALWMEGSTGVEAINTTYNTYTIYGAGPYLLRYWNLDVLVKDTSGNPIEGAAVTAKDRYGNQVFSMLTRADGRIDKPILIEYKETASGKTYYTPYTVTVTKAGYSSKNKSVNLIDNTEMFLELVSGVGVSSKEITWLGWWPYGNAAHFGVYGNYLYATSGNALLVIDITDINNPVLKGELPGAGIPWVGGPSYGRFFSLNYPYVYLAQGEAGLVIADVSSPTNPVIVNRYNLPSLSVTTVATQGNYSYLATNQGVKILDVSNPSSPVKVGELNISSSSITVSGNYAYTNSGSTINIIDISNPSVPIQVGSYSASKTVYDLAVKGNLLFGVSYGVVDIIDVSNPASPTKLNSFTWGENSYATIAVWGNYLAVAVHDNSVFFVDISDPSSPVQIARYFYSAGYPRNPIVLGNYLFLSIEYMGIEIVDITNPAAPTKKAVYHSLVTYPSGINKIPFYGRSMYTAVSGDMVYIPDDKGLITLDVSNPSNPQLKSYIDLDGRSANFAIKDNLAYLAQTWAGFRIVDVSDPANPIQIFIDNLGEYIMAVAVSGNYTYLGTDYVGFKGIWVYDVSDPASSYKVGEYNIGSDPGLRDFIISGNYLYVAGGTEGLRIFDISDPTNITQVGQFKDSQSFTAGVAVIGQYAYIGDGYLGPALRIIDVSNPTNPILVSSWDKDNIIAGFPDFGGGRAAFGGAIAALDGYVYLPAGKDGLYVIDVTDPTNPVEKGYFQRKDGSRPRGVSVSPEGIIYLAADGGGLEILTATTLGDKIALSVNSPAVNENYTTLNISISGSTNYPGNVSYSLNGNLNITLCEDCNNFSAHAFNATKFGNNTLTLYAKNESSSADMIINFNVVSLNDDELLVYMDRYARGVVTYNELLQAIDAWAKR